MSRRPITAILSIKITQPFPYGLRRKSGEHPGEYHAQRGGFTLDSGKIRNDRRLAVGYEPCAREIYKMTIRLREQQQTLTREKAYLADSIADISHQIRTPLTSINLLIGLLSEPKLTDARRQQLIHELYELLSRIDWLITTLLKISRLDAGTVQFKQEQVSLEELLKKSCVTLLIPMELRGQELRIHADGAFRGDLSWTSEAIGNIVKNCMEHTPEGGRIEIEATENALFSEIIIKDNGTGISPEDLPHIFERFYKGKDSDGKSFGIGLALSRMIIAGQGGTVKAENRKPAGAMFTIRFYKGTV